MKITKATVKFLTLLYFIQNIYEYVHNFLDIVIEIKYLSGDEFVGMKIYVKLR